MKKSLMLCGLLLALTTSIVSAAPGTNLRWNACFGDAGLTNKNSTCLVNTGSNALVGSFEIGNLPQVSGIELVIDIATASATLPAWWEFKNALTCRTASLTMNATISAAAVVCVDWAGGAAAGGLAAYNQGGLAGANTARVIAGFAVAATSIADLFAGTEYFAFNMNINNLKTVGTPSCAGCLTPACIVFNSCKAATPPVAGQPSRDVTVSGPTNGTDSHFVTWQGGVGATSARGQGCPAATPTHNATWGSVKSLYR